MNGLGPWWFPTLLRQWLTAIGELFFNEADWNIHDLSYAAKNPSRYACDRGFLAAMLRDASLPRSVAKMAVCVILAWFLWILVRLFGWLSYGVK